MNLDLESFISRTKEIRFSSTSLYLMEVAYSKRILLYRRILSMYPATLNLKQLEAKLDEFQAGILSTLSTDGSVEANFSAANTPGVTILVSAKDSAFWLDGSTLCETESPGASWRVAQLAKNMTAPNKITNRLIIIYSPDLPLRVVY